MGLAELVDLKPGTQRGLCVWQTGRLPGDASPNAQAAGFVAEQAMRERCKGAPANFELWRASAFDERELTDREREKVEPFIRTGFGLPAHPLPDDHLQGYVAEFVWFLLMRDSTSDGRELGLITGPGFHVTGPGGDGLVVYRQADTPIFRLWEIKKHHSKSHVSSTVARACKQLNTKATEYLAQLTALAEQQSDDVAVLLAQLVDLWVDGDARAGAGVAVSTSSSSHPTRCFGNMSRQFPRLTEPGQLEGLVVGLDDLPEFAERVRDTVWSAL